MLSQESVSKISTSKSKYNGMAWRLGLGRTTATIIATLLLNRSLALVKFLYLKLEAEIYASFS